MTSGCTNAAPAAFNLSATQAPSTNNFSLTYTFPGDLGTTGSNLIGYSVIWMQERPLPGGTAGQTICNTFGPVNSPDIFVDIVTGAYTNPFTQAAQFNANNSGVIGTVPVTVNPLGLPPLPAIASPGPPATTYNFNLPTGVPYTGLQFCYAIIGVDNDNPPSYSPINVTGAFTLV